MSQLLTEVCEIYFRSNIRVRKETTRTHYRRSIKQFGEFLGHAPTLDDLTDDNATGFMLWTVESGHADVTANQRVKQLRALWEWCARRRLVEMFPTFKDMVEPEPMATAWSIDELHKLFAACAKQKGWIGPHLASDWWLAFHWFLLDTAERTDAVLALRREWVDLSTAVARVPGHVRKGGRKGQVYKLSPRTVELLTKLFLVPSPTGVVFEQPWTDFKSFYKRYRRLVEDAGLPHVSRKSGPKKMRCTVLTMIEAGGGNATAFARHSDRTVTEHYLDQAVLRAQRVGEWPPEGFDPEAQQAQAKRPGLLSRLRGAVASL